MGIVAVASGRLTANDGTTYTTSSFVRSNDATNLSVSLRKLSSVQ
jgi:hypothetical protein